MPMEEEHTNETRCTLAATGLQHRDRKLLSSRTRFISNLATPRKAPMFTFNRTIRQIAMLAAGSALVVSSHAAITSNAITSNAITSNAITSNAITSNAIFANAITSNALSKNAIAAKADDQGAQRVDTDLSTGINARPVGAYTPGLSWEILQVRPWPAAIEAK
jgi:hypothetical protein